MLGKAMAYLDSQREALVRYCDDGRHGIGTPSAGRLRRAFGSVR